MNTAIPPIEANTAEPDRYHEKIDPLVKAAAELGICLRPITGLMLRLGDQFGVDINAVGEVKAEADGDPAEPSDEYYDQLMLAVWILSEDEDVLADLVADGGPKATARAHARWKMKYLTSVATEAVVMKAFIARWYEMRIEMARVYTAGDASPADAS